MADPSVDHICLRALALHPSSALSALCGLLRMTPEHGACLAPGCLEPLVRARPLAFQESDGLGGGGAGHRGAVGRHRQLERPRPVTCKAASRGMSRRPSRFSHEGRYRSHGGRHMPAAATIT